MNVIRFTYVAGQRFIIIIIIFYLFFLAPDQIFPFEIIRAATPTEPARSFSALEINENKENKWFAN